MPALIRCAIDAKMIPDWIKDLEWEGSLQGDGDLEISKLEPSFLGSLKPGRYGYNGQSLQVDQMQLHLEKKVFSLRAKMQMEEHPLWGALQVDMSKEPYGALKLFDNPKAEGLSNHVQYARQSNHLG